MAYHQNILETIGNTPLVKLNKVTEGIDATVLAKVEYINPGASVKDRIGIAIIEDAEKRGQLKPGGTIVEGTSGNTGVGLAIAATAKGYKCIFTIPDKMSQEKVNLLKALGAEVIITPTAVPPDSPDNYVIMARRLAKEIPNAILANQFFNQVNPQAHYQTTGPEIWKQTEGKVDAFVAGIGTGGTISGVGRYLKEKNPKIRIVAADPYGSVLKTFHETGKLMNRNPYLVEGIGEDIIPETLHLKYIDEIMNVTDKDSFQTARRLTREEGIFCGGSSGTVAFVALKIAKEMVKGQTIVFIVADWGEHYLSKFHNDEWMRDNHLLGTERTTLGIINATKPKNVPKLVSVMPSHFVSDALQLMNQYSISQLPVMEDEKSVGSIRESRILSKVVEDNSVLKFRVRELMDEPLPVLEESVSIDNARKILKDNPAALIQEFGRIVGIVTRYDVIELS